MYSRTIVQYTEPYSGACSHVYQASIDIHKPNEAWWLSLFTCWYWRRLERSPGCKHPQRAAGPWSPRRTWWGSPSCTCWWRPRRGVWPPWACFPQWPAWWGNCLTETLGELNFHRHKVISHFSHLGIFCPDFSIFYLSDNKNSVHALQLHTYTVVSMFNIIMQFGAEFTIQFCGIFVTTVFLPRKFNNQPRPLVRPSAVNFCQNFFNISQTQSL